MICNIRTPKGIAKEIRKLALNNRVGVVLEKIETNDIEEVVLSIDASFKEKYGFVANAFNKPIVIRTKSDKPEYSIIYMVKTNKINDIIENRNILEDICKTYNLVSFTYWVKKYKYI